MEVKQVIEILAKRFPKSFFLDPKQVRPLKIEILKDILPHVGELGVSNRAVRQALAAYTGRDAYHKAVAGYKAKRIGLDGAEIERVSPEHRKHAEAVLKERIEKNSSKAVVKKAKESKETTPIAAKKPRTPKGTPQAKTPPKQAQVTQNQHKKTVPVVKKKPTGNNDASPQVSQRGRPVLSLNR